ncbi:acetylglutamate kinase [Pleionea sediminis]|uniref:acetylglutamate kinase n=1 Tax=Pleionea sediminis TaxID=2569479 RepID=UPI001185D285|nr:acetylglutamate kinase [Pleionea sediminis]
MSLVVIKLSGKVINDFEALVSLLQVLNEWQLKFDKQLVLVHGGGSLCDKWSQAFELEVAKWNGIPVKPKNQLPIIIGALAGYSHTQVMSASKEAGLKSVSVTPATGEVLTCKLHPKASELGRVGTVSPGNPELILQLIHQKYTPIFHSIGLSQDGECLNINSDDVATQLALTLNAEELILLSDIEGIFNEKGNLIKSIDANKVDELKPSSFVSDGMIAKLHSLAKVSNSSVSNIAITSAANHKKLLQVLNGGSACTRIISASKEGM